MSYLVMDIKLSPAAATATTTATASVPVNVNMDQENTLSDPIIQLNNDSVSDSGRVDSMNHTDLSCTVSNSSINHLRQRNTSIIGGTIDTIDCPRYALRNCLTPLTPEGTK